MCKHTEPWKLQATLHNYLSVLVVLLKLSQWIYHCELNMLARHKLCFFLHKIKLLHDKVLSGSPGNEVHVLLNPVIVKPLYLAQMVKYADFL